MSAIISFDHSNLYSNKGLVPSSSFQVGHSTNITISLHNTGSTIGDANVHLWWIGPTLSSTSGPMFDLVNGNRLAPPYGAAYPIIFSVMPTTGSKITVAWTPSALDFPHSLGATVPGCLFAQVEVLPAPPIDPGDTSALSNWSPAYVLCAQHNIQITT
jgi:hypothetical protein